MVFRTVYITKTKSNTRKGCCNYLFELVLNVNKDKEDAFDILLYASEAFYSKRYFGIGTIKNGENNKIVMQLRDFPVMKERLLLKDLKKFSNRLLEKTGTSYLFKLEEAK